MQQPPARDRRGYYRSPVTLSDYRRGKPSPNKGRRFPPEPLTPREVLALIDVCGRGSAGRRNRALIVMLWRAGLRISEALALYPKDVDLTAGTVQVLHGKGDRRRLVGIDPMACSVISEWMAERRDLGLTGRHPLFCVISKPSVGAAMHAVYVRNLFKELAAKAGIEKRVHPHGLRHTHAADLDREKVSVMLISHQLGHQDLGTTARYLSHLNNREVVEAMRARQWPGQDPGAAPPALSPRALELDEPPPLDPAA